MYYLTQVLKGVVKDDHAMFLGFSGDLKTTYYLTEELKEVTNVGKEYKSFEPYPYLISVGFFGGVDSEKLLEFVDNATLKLFIKSGGTNKEAKEQLQKQLDYP